MPLPGLKPSRAPESSCCCDLSRRFAGISGCKRTQERDPGRVGRLPRLRGLSNRVPDSLFDGARRAALTGRRPSWARVTGCAKRLADLPV